MANAAHNHTVQFYGKDGGLLVQNVAAYLAESLRDGAAAVVIASREHCDAVTERVGASSQLVCRDAVEALAKFMVDGQPDAKLFDRTVGELARKLQAQYGRVRAYGEMVGLLWEAHQPSAAIALEHLWNGLLATTGLELFCGYPIDVTSPHFQIGSIDAVLAAHSNVVTGTRNEFQTALERAMEDVLGPRATGLRLLAGPAQSRSWPQMPHPERTILWLRNNLPYYAEEIVRKAAEY